MRCIDADALRESLDIDVFDCFKCKHGVSIYGHCSRGGEFQKACNEIEFAQTIDVAPVRHGRWITHHEKVALLNGEAFGGVYCSECGYKTHNRLHVILGCPFKYCPNCGARMDGKGNGNETD